MGCVVIRVVIRFPSDGASLPSGPHAGEPPRLEGMNTNVIGG